VTDGRSARNRKNGANGRRSGRIARMRESAIGRRMEIESGEIRERWSRWMRRCGLSRDGGLGEVFWWLLLRRRVDMGFIGGSIAVLEIS
jgi:hypothetical protein